MRSDSKCCFAFVVDEFSWLRHTIRTSTHGTVVQNTRYPAVKHSWKINAFNIHKMIIGTSRGYFSISNFGRERQGRFSTVYRRIGWFFSRGNSPIISDCRVCSISFKNASRLPHLKWNIQVISQGLAFARSLNGNKYEWPARLQSWRSSFLFGLLYVRWVPLLNCEYTYSQEHYNTNKASIREGVCSNGLAKCLCIVYTVIRYYNGRLPYFTSVWWLLK